MPVFLQVIIGSALGGLLRYLCMLYLPLPILLVNVFGSLVIGFTTARLGILYPQYLPFINIGILGGLTTFSSFSLETLRYIQDGKLITAAVYVSLSFFTYFYIFMFHNLFFSITIPTVVYF